VIPESHWIGGLAEWIEGDTAFLSVAFTWKLDEAFRRALFFRAIGYKVRAGGPALFQAKMRHELVELQGVQVGGDYKDAIAHHNPAATVFSRGCPEGCGFCIVTPMEGAEFTLIPDAPVRPVLCDNNLSALPAQYQDFIISDPRAAVPLRRRRQGSVGARVGRQPHSCGAVRPPLLAQPEVARDPRIAGPGEKIVLLTPCARALFVWRKFISKDQQDGVNCAIFRNEGAGLASDLIRVGDGCSRGRAGQAQRLYTYVNPRRVRSSNPGFCFKQAGWRGAGSRRRGAYPVKARPDHGRCRCCAT
jgi:hypothetical protein